MMQVRIWLNIFLVVSLSFASNIVVAKNTSDSDQLDEQDRQEFNLRIERANACTKSRDFVCAEQQLGKAKSYVNGSRDRNVLQNAMESLELQRQLAMRDDAKQKYAGQREVVEANAGNTERELAAARRQDIAAANEAARRAERERERRQPTSQPQANLIDEINKTAEKNMAVLDTINRQTKEAYADSNRVLASQAADRKREEHERAEQRSRDDERDRNSRIASAEAQRERDNRAEQAQAREQEQRRQKEEHAAADRRAKEQEQARLQEEKRQQEAKAVAEKKAEQQRQTEAKAQAAPPFGGPPNKDGCWIPDRRNPCVVVESSVKRGTEVHVKYRNDCAWGVYVEFGNEKTDGKWDGGRITFLLVAQRGGQPTMALATTTTSLQAPIRAQRIGFARGLIRA